MYTHTRIIIIIINIIYYTRVGAEAYVCVRACVRACWARAADVRHHENLRARERVFVCIQGERYALAVYRYNNIGLVVKNAMLYRVCGDGVLPHSIP